MPLESPAAIAPPCAGSARSLVAVWLASAGWGFGFGLGAPLASLWLRDAGRGATAIGLNTAVYYLGVALAALAVPVLMRRWGTICPIVGMVLSGLAVGLFPWAHGSAAWYGIRALNGIAGALTIIPLETLVNERSSATHRARNFGLYAFSMAFGWALGNLVGLELYPSAPRQAFLLGGAASVLAGIVFFLIYSPVKPQVTARPVSHAPLDFRHNFLSFGSAWGQGFLEGGMVALLPVYLLSLGLKEHAIGATLSGIMLGVIAFQVPVAWAADRFGRTAVLLCCYAATMVGLGALGRCGPGPWLTAWLFVVGACSGAFYPLGLAILGAHLPTSALARANAWYLAINCVGSLIGPAVSGAAMDLFGGEAMFLSAQAAVAGIFFLWLVLRLGCLRPGIRSAESDQMSPSSGRAAA